MLSMAAYSIRPSSAALLPMPSPPPSSCQPSGNLNYPYQMYYKQQCTSVAHPSESSQGSHTSSIMSQRLPHNDQTSYSVPNHVRSETSTHTSHVNQDACSSPIKLQENVVSSTGMKSRLIYKVIITVIFLSYFTVPPQYD